MKHATLATLAACTLLLAGCGGSGGVTSTGNPFTGVSPFVGSWTGNVVANSVSTAFNATVASDGTVTGGVLSTTNSGGQVTGIIHADGSFNFTVGASGTTGQAAETGSVAINGQKHMVGSGTMVTNGQSQPFTFDLVKVLVP